MNRKHLSNNITISISKVKSFINYPKRENKIDYYKKKFSSITPEDYKEYPEIIGAVNYDKRVNFDFLSKEKPMEWPTEKIENKHKKKFILSINSFRQAFFNYNIKTKKGLKSFCIFNKENKAFKSGYQALKNKEELYNKDKTLFLDLKNEYENKKMHAPSLSNKHNLFNKNLLLLDLNELENYYPYQQENIKSKSKAFEYLMKMKENVHEREIIGLGNAQSGLLFKNNGNIDLNIFEKENVKNAQLAPVREKLQMKRNIRLLKRTINNIEDLEDFYREKPTITPSNWLIYESPETNINNNMYISHRNQLLNKSSRMSSGKYSTRVGSAVKPFTSITKSNSINCFSPVETNGKKVTLNSSIFQRNVYFNSGNRMLSGSSSQQEIFKSTLEKWYDESKKNWNSTSIDTLKDNWNNYLSKKNYILNEDISPNEFYKQMQMIKDIGYGRDFIKEELDFQSDKTSRDDIPWETKQKLEEKKEFIEQMKICERKINRIVFNVNEFQ